MTLTTRWMAIMTAVALNAAVGAIPDDAMCAKIMRGIAQVESGDKDIGVHQDGVSFGRYGVTQVAVDELIRTHTLQEGTYVLTDPAINYKCARLYLLLMFKRAHGSWWNAVEMYHGSTNKQDRYEYAKAVWRAME